MNSLNITHQHLSGSWNDDWFHLLDYQPEHTKNPKIRENTPPLFQGNLAQPDTNERGSKLLQSATVSTQPSYQDIFQTTVNPKFENQQNSSTDIIVMNEDGSFSFTSNTPQTQITSEQYFSTKSPNTEHAPSLSDNDHSLYIDQSVNEEKHTTKKSKTIAPALKKLSAEEKKIKRRESNRLTAKLSRDRKKQESDSFYLQIRDITALGQRIETYVEEHLQKHPFTPLQGGTPVTTIDFGQLTFEQKTALFRSYLGRMEDIVHNFGNALTAQQLASELDKERIKQLEAENAHLKKTLLASNPHSVNPPSSTASNFS